jgi:prepilin-type N-terminal cleavage/methylation domain-containing protein
MDSLSVSLKAIRHKTQSSSRPDGFSLLEMMMVVTVILIVASISAPIYVTAVVRAREAVLADDLFTLRALIDRFTLDPADAGPRPCLAPRNRGKRLSGKNPNRPLHGIKRDLAGDKGRRAPLTNANGAGDCGRTQRIEPRFPRRHSVQQLVGFLEHVCI